MKLKKFIIRGLFTLLLATSHLVTHAALKEEQFELPVVVASDSLSLNKTQTHNITVTVFSDDDNPKPAPILIFNHGRAPSAQDRANFGRSRYSKAAQFFVEHGFIVALPTRVGYGVTGGEDVEDSGACHQKNYSAGFNPGVQQTLAVLNVLRQRPDAAANRTVVMGQSFGGALAVAIAAQNPMGVVGAINFAGGAGGNPSTSPQRPCMPERLEKTFADYGKTARIPMLWIYAENDLFFGAQYPRRWFEAFTLQGGKAEFVQFPPNGQDGHSLFSRAPDVWQPKVVEFLARLGFLQAARQ